MHNSRPNGTRQQNNNFARPPSTPQSAQGIERTIHPCVSLLQDLSSAGSSATAWEAYGASFYNRFGNTSADKPRPI